MLYHLCSHENLRYPSTDMKNITMMLRTLVNFGQDINSKSNDKYPIQLICENSYDPGTNLLIVEFTIPIF